LELFHHKLFKIFYDDNQKIEANDMNELKKISLAFIIQGKDVSNIFGEYLENTLNNNFNQLDEQRKVLIGHKKSEVYFCLEELGEIILNKIDKKNNDEINAFIGELRNKYGISEEDISNDDLNEKTLLELFHHKLFKIFYDDNQKIEANDMNELKKISLAFIIQGKDVSNIFSEYLGNTLNNNFNQLDEQRKVLIGNKKSEVYFCLEELGEIKLNKIDKKNNDEINEFIGELRNKYGISEDDINNDDLNKEIKSNKYDKKKIIESILKKIKLIKDS
jgi:hypothetical protein